MIIIIYNVNSEKKEMKKETLFTYAITYHALYAYLDLNNV
jgi:hypothetical protein